MTNSDGRQPTRRELADMTQNEPAGARILGCLAATTGGQS